MPEAKFGDFQKKDWGLILSDPWSNLEKINPEITKYKDFTELKKWYEERVKQLPEFQVEDAPLADGEVWQSIIPTEGGNEKDASLLDKLGIITPDKIEGLDDETRKSVDEIGLKLYLKGYNLFATKGTSAEEKIIKTVPVEKIGRKDGQFYTVEGRRFKKVNSDGKVVMDWNQPVLISKESPTEVKIFGEEVKIPVNGILGVIRDTEGRVLTVVDQEAMAETPNHAIIRLAIQASSSKISLMRSGKPEADKQLSELLKIYSNGDIEDLFKKAEYVLPIAPEDTNRDLKHNLVLVMQPVDSNSSIHSGLEDNGVRKWLTPEQIALTNIARLTNSHTMAAIKIYSDIKTMRALR